MDALLPCVQENFETVREACDYSCQPHALATGLTVKHFLEKDFSFFKLFDKHMTTLSTNEACRVGKCLLKCYRTKLNIRCQGMAGSLLTEGIVRPFADIQRQGTAFSGMFQMIMPRQCTFLSNENELNEFKIDPQLDGHIKALYDGLSHPQDVAIPDIEGYSATEKSPLDYNS
uniref:CPG4 domain-containing protein n=2 Tax=Bursaphelenchus xylophilus TaxID=6326 RepID=A0A1I7SGX1_BURXY